MNVAGGMLSIFVVTPVSFALAWRETNKKYLTRGYGKFRRVVSSLVMSSLFSVLMMFFGFGLSETFLPNGTATPTEAPQTQVQIVAQRAAQIDVERVKAAAKAEAALTPKQRKQREKERLLAEKKAKQEAEKQAKIAKQEAEKQAKLAKAEAEKQALIVAAAEREEKIKKQFAPWDGSNRPLERLIKLAMKNPDSYQHVATTYIDKGDYLIVKTTYRGTNSFNAIVPETATAKIDLEGNILEAH